jgi:very-short-patch-repair endonuclease
MTERAVLKLRASEMRKNQTPAERALWTRLRTRQLCGVRFLRQYTVGNYIVDFCAPSLKLAIELDGGQHCEPASVEYDKARGQWLAAQGIVVLRYTNLDVMRRINDVLASIQHEVVRLRELHPPAAARRPPSFRRG